MEEGNASFLPQHMNPITQTRGRSMHFFLQPYVSPRQSQNSAALLSEHNTKIKSVALFIEEVNVRPRLEAVLKSKSHAFRGRRMDVYVLEGSAKFTFADVSGHIRVHGTWGIVQDLQASDFCLLHS